VHAKQTLLATGAIEQPLVFEQNDLPGIMLSGAIRQYANRYGVAAGKQIVLATNNDSAYLAALDLVAAGANVALVLDSRTEAPADLAKWLRAQHVECGPRRDVKAIAASVSSAQLSAGEDVDCDALGVSGGWQPAVHLWSHARAPVPTTRRAAASGLRGHAPPCRQSDR
jgi:sarcosine oxidase subunit alpha